MSEIAYIKTYQVAYPLDRPLSDSIHYMPVRAVGLVDKLGSLEEIAEAIKRLWDE